MKVTFACVLVEGNVPYDGEYVRLLRAAVRKYYRFEHRFVCLTDASRRVPDGIDTIHVPSVGKLPGWWAKINLFDPKLGLEDRVVYLDLDVLPVDSLCHIVRYPSPFALVPHAGDFRGRNGLQVVPRYNSSVMVWNVSERLHKLHALWNVGVTRRLWGDQDYIGQMLPNEDTMPREWFPRLSEVGADFFKDAEHATSMLLAGGAKVVLSKKPKNREAAATWPWFSEMWRGAEAA